MLVIGYLNEQVFNGIQLFCDFSFLFHEFSLQLEFSFYYHGETFNLAISKRMQGSVLII